MIGYSAHAPCSRYNLLSVNKIRIISHSLHKVEVKIQEDSVAEVIRECPLPSQTSVHKYYSHRGGKMFRDCHLSGWPQWGWSGGWEPLERTEWKERVGRGLFPGFEGQHLAALTACPSRPLSSRQTHLGGRCLALSALVPKGQGSSTVTRPRSV